MSECCRVEHAIVFIVALFVYMSVAVIGYKVLRYEAQVRAYELNVLIDVRYYKAGLLEIMLNNPYTSELCVKSIIIYEADGDVIYNISVNEYIRETDTMVYIYPIKLNNNKYIIEILLEVYGYKYNEKKMLLIENT